MDSEVVVDFCMNYVAPCTGFCLFLSAVLLVTRRGSKEKDHAYARDWFVLVAGLTGALVVGYVMLNVELPLPPTQFAPEYSRWQFNSVRAGDRVDSVYAKLGSPLSVPGFDETIEAETRYVYDPIGVTVYVRTNIVKGWDAPLVRSIPMCMYGLKTVDDIRAKLGDPSSVETGGSWARLMYSSSPGSTHESDHWIRTIYVDQATRRVVKKESGFYWSW